MTGPEHYRAAEQLADRAEDLAVNGRPEAAATAMIANVHAKLAAVASYVESDLQHDVMTDEAGAAWRKAIGWPS